MNRERLLIMRKLQLRPETLKEILFRYGFVSSVSTSIYDAISSIETIKSIRSPESLAHRYLIEDIGYGLVPIANIARCFDITTPTIDSLINLACILNKLDHWNEGLTVKRLGINNMNPHRLKDFLEFGI